MTQSPLAAPPGMMNYLPVLARWRVGPDDARAVYSGEDVELGNRVAVAEAFTFVRDPSDLRSNVGELMILHSSTAYTVKVLARVLNKHTAVTGTVGLSHAFVATIKRLSVEWQRLPDWQRFAAVLLESALFRNRMSHCSFQEVLSADEQWIFLIEEDGQIGLRIDSVTFARLIEFERMMLATLSYIAWAPEFRSDVRIEKLGTPLLESAISHGIRATLLPSIAEPDLVGEMSRPSVDALFSYLTDASLGVIPAPLPKD